jgi:Repeat of unknown function (DUF5648)
MQDILVVARSRISFLLAAIALLATPLSSWSFLIGPQPPSPISIVEYFNTGTGHYFYTLSQVEEAAIASGAEGQGWVKTGLSFAAFPSVEASRYLGTACDSGVTPCQPVSRFYAPGPNSHFFTGRPDELRILMQPGTGWFFETVAFYVPLPDQSGNCSTSGFLVPVYRMYNNRSMFNDSNHRYTASAAARANMLAQGWGDEGVAFCSYGSGNDPIEVLAFALDDPAGIQAAPACKSDDLATHPSCVALENLPVPWLVIPGDPSYDRRDLFDVRVGWSMPGVYTRNAVLYADLLVASSRTFVQLTTVDGGDQLGIHLNTADRLGSMHTSISPIRKLVTAAPSDGQPDPRLFPYRLRYGTPYEVYLRFFLGLTAFTASPGSSVDGAGSIEFLDTRSGRKLRLNAVAYGNLPSAEYVTSDGATGMAVVATTFGRPSSLGRFVGPMIDQATARTRDIGQTFSASLNRAEFQAVIDLARTRDPNLSSDPADYAVDNIAQVNEVSGDGDIALFGVGPLIALLPQS